MNVIFLIENIINFKNYLLGEEDLPRKYKYAVSFPCEASDIWILMQKCHWYIWLYLIFILVFVLVLFYLILVESAIIIKNPRTTSDFYLRYLVLKWAKVTHISSLETGWTTLPCIILILIGFKSIYTLYMIDSPYPGKLLVVKALGRQWFWQYEVIDPFVAIFKGVDASIVRYTFDSYMVMLNSEINDGSDRRNLKVDTALTLPVAHSVRFIATGMDVLHSFAIPSFGLKLDAVPGRLNSTDVLLKRHGLFYGQCSELCGQGHAFMPIVVYVPEAQI